jgi:hypothetical protein
MDEFLAFGKGGNRISVTDSTKITALAPAATDTSRSGKVGEPLPLLPLVIVSFLSRRSSSDSLGFSRDDSRLWGGSHIRCIGVALCALSPVQRGPVGRRYDVNRGK